MQDYINCNQRPLLFLGCNRAILILKELCEEHNIEIAGIIDSDYFSNYKDLEGIPFVGTEDWFNDPKKLEYYQNNYNFFCASNWTPEDNPVQKRNRNKRRNLINMLDSFELKVISLIDPRSNVSKYANIGKGVFIDAMCNIEPGVQIDDYVNIMWGCGIGHHTVIERNCVIQRQVWTGGFCHFEEECFIGIGAKTLKQKARFGKDTWIQEMVYIKRGTVPGEVVGFEGNNQKRVIIPGSIN